MAQAGHKVQVRTLQIAPILFTIGPYHTDAFFVLIAALSSYGFIIYIVLTVIDFQEWTSRTFFVFREIWVIPNVYFIVLEQLILLRVTLVLGMSDSVHEHWLFELKTQH